MPFYAFRLNSILVKNPRGKVPDDDIVTFQVVVNNVLRGQGSILLTDLAAGALIPLVPPPSTTYTFTPLAPNPGTAKNISVDWIIGPLMVAPTDGVTILYSGTNLSDNYSGPSQADQDDLEIRILNAFYGALWGQIVDGPVGAALGSVRYRRLQRFSGRSGTCSACSKILSVSFSTFRNKVPATVPCLRARRS